MELTIVEREGWTDRKPKSVKSMHPSRRDRVFVHWPAMPAQMSDHQMLLSAIRYHQDSLGWSDIAYTVALGTDGKMYILRGIGVAGGHTKGENDDSYAILVLTGEGEQPTAEQEAAFPKVVEWLRVNDPLLGEREDVVVMGHRHDDQASTACPGPDWAAFAWDYKHSRDYKDPAPAPAPAPAPVEEFPPTVTEDAMDRLALLEIRVAANEKALSSVINADQIREAFYAELRLLAERG